MKKQRLFTIIIVVMISIFLLTTALSVAVRGDDELQSFGSELMDDEEEDDDEEDDDSIPRSNQLIGHEEALNITYEKYNGTLVDFELDEDDDGNYTYDIEIIGDGDEQRIVLDAYTGEELDSEVTEYDGDLNPDWDQLIGREEALDIAYQRANGTLVIFELEEEDEDNYTYEIEIVENQREYELELDAYTGEVLESEVDDPEESRRGRGVGRSWNGTQGNFTSFDLLEDGISNYTLHTNNTNLLLFEKVMVQNLTIEETETKGARYEIEGNDTEISIYHVAPALMKINTESEDDDEENGPRRVSFDLGDLEVGEQDGPNLNLSFSNHTAKLLSISPGDGPWNESLDINVSEGVVNYTFEEDIFLLFRMTDFETREREREREREMERNILRGISQGEVGGEVIVDRDEHGFSEMSVNYTDMKIETQAKDDKSIQSNVSSKTLGDEGKIVAYKIYKEALNVENLEELEIRYDGEEIDMAEDYDDLVNPSDGAEYLVSIGSDSIEVLVMVPHFSSHIIEIADVEETSDGGAIPGFTTMLLLLSAVIAAAVYRKKKR